MYPYTVTFFVKSGANPIKRILSLKILISLKIVDGAFNTSNSTNRSSIRIKVTQAPSMNLRLVKSFFRQNLFYMIASRIIKNQEFKRYKNWCKNVPEECNKKLVCVGNFLTFFQEKNLFLEITNGKYFIKKYLRQKYFWDKKKWSSMLSSTSALGSIRPRILRHFYHITFFSSTFETHPRK